MWQPDDNPLITGKSDETHPTRALDHWRGALENSSIAGSCLPLRRGRYTSPLTPPACNSRASRQTGDGRRATGDGRRHSDASAPASPVRANLQVRRYQVQNSRNFHHLLHDARGKTRPDAGIEHALSECRRVEPQQDEYLAVQFDQHYRQLSAN